MVSDSCQTMKRTASQGPLLGFRLEGQFLSQLSEAGHTRRKEKRALQGGDPSSSPEERVEPGAPRGSGCASPEKGVGDAFGSPLLPRASDGFRCSAPSA